MDINALKAKLANLTAKKENKKATSEHMLKLEEGVTTLRILPLASSPDNAFQTLYFHYKAIPNRTYLSPRSYGERDPIADFSDELVSEGGMTTEEYKKAKSFSPDMRYYALVIVRGKESEGPKWWGFGEKVFLKIAGIMADDDYGDITDPDNGFDLKVTFTPAEKTKTNFADISPEARRNPSPLSTDPKQAKQWLTQQPVLLDQFTKYTAEQLENALADVLNPNKVKASDRLSAVAVTPPQSSAQTNDDGGADDAPEPVKPARPAGRKPKAADPELEKNFEELFNSSDD